MYNRDIKLADTVILILGMIIIALLGWLHWGIILGLVLVTISFALWISA